MVYYVHINRGVIDSNRKYGRNDPPIRIQRGKYGKPEYGYRCELPEGSVILYDREGSILPCGARLVIASQSRPILE